MQCKAVHQIFDIFYSILKKRSKLGQKKQFFGFFQWFFNSALLRHPSYALIFCQIKVITVIHNRGKFH